MEGTHVALSALGERLGPHVTGAAVPPAHSIRGVQSKHVEAWRKVPAAQLVTGATHAEAAALATCELPQAEDPTVPPGQTWPGSRPDRFRER